MSSFPGRKGGSQREEADPALKAVARQAVELPGTYKLNYFEVTSDFCPGQPREDWGVGETGEWPSVGRRKA